MFRFEEPAYLWLLLLIPALCALRFLLMRQQKKRWRKFADPMLIKQLAPDVSLVRRILKFILLMVALALLIVMLAPMFTKGETCDQNSFAFFGGTNEPPKRLYHFLAAPSSKACEAFWSSC